MPPRSHRNGLSAGACVAEAGSSGLVSDSPRDSQQGEPWSYTSAPPGRRGAPKAQAVDKGRAGLCWQLPPRPLAGHTCARSTYVLPLAPLHCTSSSARLPGAKNMWSTARGTCEEGWGGVGGRYWGQPAMQHCGTTTVTPRLAAASWLGAGCAKLSWRAAGAPHTCCT